MQTRFPSRSLYVFIGKQKQVRIVKTGGKKRDINERKTGRQTDGQTDSTVARIKIKD